MEGLKTKITAIANTNIALVKYWGKRDTNLILPFNSSISMTLDKLYTKTTVEFSDSYRTHEIMIDGKTIEGEEYTRTVKHLEMLKEIADYKGYAKVISENNFPKKAGIASSASGFAALTLSATKALNLNLDKKDLSILARRGSGSASRSIEGGFVEWIKGNQSDGLDSYGKSLASKDHWSDLALIVTILDPRKKKTGSRAGMKQTVDTSPLYKTWLETVDEDLLQMKKAILERNFTLLGSTAELNALKMHATMHTTSPPLMYWKPESIVLMEEVMSFREKGVECYFTIDAGPQIKILCLDKDVPTIEKRLSELTEVKSFIVCHAGDEARLSNEPLF
ncbi:MAG: diphosphomevalonate decarboxylase [Promethearchaeota archaeon]